VTTRGSKIFGVGLSKTATHSLTRALTILGYRAVHWQETHRMISYCGAEPVVHYEQFETRDAFTDTPIARVYPRLDSRFPGSRFILTVRDEQEWADSFRSHFLGKNLDQFTRQLHLDLYGTLSLEPGDLIPAFRDHASRVREYFRGREDDLLVIDIAGGQGWATLCPFLGVPEPRRKEFPVAFTRRDRERVTGSRWQRLLARPQTIPAKLWKRLRRSG